VAGWLAGWLAGCYMLPLTTVDGKFYNFIKPVFQFYQNQITGLKTDIKYSSFFLFQTNITNKTSNTYWKSINSLFIFLIKLSKTRFV
jgi:hypothetical protein